MHAMHPMAVLFEFTITKVNPVYARYCQSTYTDIKHVKSIDVIPVKCLMLGYGIYVYCRPIVI